MPTAAPRPALRLSTVALGLAAVVVLAGGALLAAGLDASMLGPVAVALLVSGALGAVLAWRSSPAAQAGLHAPGECERELLALTDSLPLGVVVLADGRVRSANPAACTQLGLDAAQLADADARALFAHADDALAALSGAPFDRDVRLRRGPGDYPAHVSVRPVALGDREVQLLLASDLSERERTAARLDRQREELRTLARRLMTVQEDERAALSRELHDDIGQAITAIKLCASSLLHERDPVRHAVVTETAQEIADVADETVAKLRDLSLLLRPPQLDVLGLEAALRWQAGTLFRGDGPSLTLEVPPLPCRPPREVELACFRIAQEALTNVLRHARAERVVLRLDCDDTHLRLEVQDDGAGLAPDRRDGLGLVTMRERAQQLGGTFSVDTGPEGTRIDAVLPLSPAVRD